MSHAVSVIWAYVCFAIGLPKMHGTYAQIHSNSKTWETILLTLRNALLVYTSGIHQLALSDLCNNCTLSCLNVLCQKCIGWVVLVGSVLVCSRDVQMSSVQIFLGKMCLKK